MLRADFPASAAFSCEQGKATGTYVHFDPVQDGADGQTLTIRGPMLKVYRAHALLMRRYHETTADVVQDSRSWELEREAGTRMALREEDGRLMRIEFRILHPGLHGFVLESSFQWKVKMPKIATHSTPQPHTPTTMPGGAFCLVSQLFATYITSNFSNETFVFNDTPSLIEGHEPRCGPRPEGGATCAGAACFLVERSVVPRKMEKAPRKLKGSGTYLQPSSHAPT